MADISISAPMTSIVLKILVSPQDAVQTGDPVIILEAMKMETVIKAEADGVIQEVHAEIGALVNEGQVLLRMRRGGEGQENSSASEDQTQTGIRPDLQELLDRRAWTLDAARPERVAKRHSKGQRTARENITDLVDEGSFVEHASLIIAAQRSRRKLDDLIQNTPYDGLIGGIAAINGHLFEEQEAQCMVMSYDYMILAGTQGVMGHKKTDRLLHIAQDGKLPIVFFVEGGGGRPGDIDFHGVGGLDVMTFYLFAKLNAVVPRIAIVSGYCFAGNAAIAGCADVIIATENTSIGMGGPAMIEGGGLGVHHPKDVGPSDIQAKNGVIDVLVKDEAEAVQVAKKYLSYFQGPIKDWSCADQEQLRHLIPENRRRVYDVRTLIQTMADSDSVLELRKEFAPGMITAFIRVEGRPLGLIANNTSHMGGAIFSDEADKAARFMQLCNAFGIPILSLCDTPGIMVGPEAEKTGTVRHASRLFVIGGKLRVPIFMIVLRRAYGLGSMAMGGGSFHIPFFTVSWPTGEFGGMGLEGAVRLGYRKELESVKDPEKREALFEKLVAKSYEKGKALSTATYLEIDEVIDPAESRRWIVNGLKSTSGSRKAPDPYTGFVDTW